MAGKGEIERLVKIFGKYKLAFWSNLFKEYIFYFTRYKLNSTKIMHVFRAAKTGLSPSEQIRITLIYVTIISFLCLWNIRMHNTINHEVNSL